MSWQASHWARDQRTGSVAAKAILLVLAEHVGSDGRCRLSVATIAERTELKRSAVLKHLQILEGAALIRRTRRTDQFGHRTTDEIQLAFDREVQGPQDAPRDEAKVHETNLGPSPRSTKQGAKVHETGLLGPPYGPEKVSEKVVSARAAPRKAESPIQEGFPDQEAIERERSFLRERGWNIDAALEAESFRSHALTHDRRVKVWAAAFHQWVVKSIGRAPASARIATMPADKPIVAPGDLWRPRLSAFADPANRHWNTTDWGPKPGQPGCRAPPALVAQMGLNVVTLPRSGAA
ncbi:MAG: helix-turn-helix domain-containing protein [Caulobacteraceae bacterium]